MGFCRSAVCVLILLLYLHCAVSEAAPGEKTVSVFFNDSAILPCSGSPCSGTVSWLNLQNFSYVAQCDQSSCNSTEGFQMSHPDYRTGNFSLNITAVNPSNAGLYGCLCGHTPLQEVRLQLKNTYTVLVEFDGTAVLPCSVRCSGVVRWTTVSDIVAECDQTSCRSVKEGYQMIYNQSMQGNLSLIITEADFSKRGYYTCDCDGIYLCHDRLQIKPLRTQRQIKPDDSLVMELEILDPVEVIYQETGAANQTGRQICTVEKRSSQVTPPYTRRTSLPLELRGMKKTESGVYTIRDIENKEDLHIYNVTVQEEHHPHGEDLVTKWWFCLIVGTWVVFFISVVVLVAVVVRMCKNNNRPCKERLGLQTIRCRASEEVSETTEQQSLTATDDLDNRDSPPAANGAETRPECIPSCRSEITSVP